LYDIGPYRSQIREFHGELLKTLERGDLAISRIFEILPVQVVTPDGQKRLEARGDGYLRRSEGVFVNASSEAQDIEFMDDALGKITVLFPASVKVQISLSGGGISLTSVGSPIEVTIPSLPEEIMSAPVKFSSFVIGDDFMQTHIVDNTGTEVLIDGKLAEGSNEFFITKDMLLLVSSFEDYADCLVKRKDDKKGDRTYKILRDNNNGVCTVDFMGGEVGGRTVMGSYDSYEAAAKDMKEMYKDGRCGPPPDP